MPPHRQATPREQRLAQLTAGLPVTCRTTIDSEDGLFASKAISEGTVIFCDTPLCWLPQQSQLQHCTACGAFVG
jgi:hypothetical protein